MGPKSKQFLGNLGKGFALSTASSLGQGLMSAAFSGLYNRRAKSLYKFQKQQDLQYQKDLSEYLTTNQSAWEKQSLRNAGLSTASLGGQATLAGTSLGSGNLQGQAIDPGQFALADAVTSLAEASRADSQARLYDKQVNWYDRQAQTDLDLKSSQIGLNDESRRVQIALGEKYTAERLNIQAARAGIQAQSELARDMIKSQIGVNDSNANKLAKEAELVAKNIATYDQKLKFELDKWAAETKASLGTAAAAFATISVCKAQARLMGSQADRIDKMTPQELRKMVQDTAHVTQMIQNFSNTTAIISKFNTNKNRIISTNSSRSSQGISSSGRSLTRNDKIHITRLKSDRTHIHIIEKFLVSITSIRTQTKTWGTIRTSSTQLVLINIKGAINNSSRNLGLSKRISFNLEILMIIQINRSTCNLKS